MLLQSEIFHPANILAAINGNRDVFIAALHYSTRDSLVCPLSVMRDYIALFNNDTFSI